MLFEGTRQELAARVPQHLMIKVDRRDEALPILERAGFAVDSRHAHLTIHNATTETAREAYRVLVTNGIGVHHLSIKLATLERQFHQLLSTIKVWSECEMMHALVSTEIVKLKPTSTAWFSIVFPLLLFVAGAD
jgi:hypothetical protein